MKPTQSVVQPDPKPISGGGGSSSDPSTVGPPETYEEKGAGSTFDAAIEYMRLSKQMPDCFEKRYLKLCFYLALAIC